MKSSDARNNKLTRHLFYSLYVDMGAINNEYLNNL